VKLASLILRIGLFLTLFLTLRIRFGFWMNFYAVGIVLAMARGALSVPLSQLNDFTTAIGLELRHD
jgi:hypothetical protein